jgi:outer membrane receptor protein involved in Fe transport
VRSNADFDDFILGTCWTAFPFHTGMPDPGTLGPLGTCDHSGGRVAYNPENQVFVAATKDFRLGNSTTLFIRGEYSYGSDLFTDGDTDPLTLVDGYDIVNLRLGLIFENMDAELTFWGRNITDEAYYGGSFDPPLQAGKNNYYPQEPVTWGVTFRKNF